MACEVKELKAQNRAQSQAQARADRQARELDAQAAYQAELDADLARFEMQLEMEAAEQARADQACYRRAMWEQTPDGQAWADLSRRGQQWMAQAKSHDDALLTAWQRAVEPRWADPEFEKAQRAAAHKIGLPASIAVRALGISGIFFLMSMMWNDTSVRVVMWLALGVAIVFGVLWFKARPRYEAAARPLSQLRENNDEVKAFAERYGANPFTEPEKLPSWREGLTRGQNAAQIQAVENWVHLDLNKFPSASSLPTLPPLVTRSDLSAWPESVAHALPTRLEQN